MSTFIKRLRISRWTQRVPNPCNAQLKGNMTACCLDLHLYFPSGLNCDLCNIKSLNNFLNILMRIVTPCHKSRSRRHTNSPLMVGTTCHPMETCTILLLYDETKIEEDEVRPKLYKTKLAKFSDFV